MSFFIFGQYSCLNSGWAVIATISIHELTLHGQNINDGFGKVAEMALNFSIAALEKETDRCQVS